jgi:ribosomal protein S18 acetylase RimI-like enzyme
MTTPAVVSAAASAAAAERSVTLQPSSGATTKGEAALWRACVSWGVNPMPCRLVAVATDGSVVGAAYYSLARPRAFLSALAVMPSARGQRLGKLLIAASVAHMRAAGSTAVDLHVLACDASVERHGLYTSCGFRGGDAAHGGTYTLAAIPEDYERAVLQAPRSRPE